MKTLSRAMCVFSVIIVSSSSGAVPPWIDATGNLLNVPSTSGYVPSLVSAVPGKDKVIAGVQSLWATTDGGVTWVQMGTGAGSEQINNRPIQIVYDPLNPDIFWECGGFASTGSLVKTIDGGNTFHPLNPPGEVISVSVDFSDPQRRTIVAGRNGQIQTVYKSTDGGSTWTNIGATLPAGTAYSEYPYVIDSLTYLLGCSYNGPGGCCNGNGTNGLYRTTDGGATWTSVSTVAVFKEPLIVGDTIFWANYSNGLIKSGNKGLTWTSANAGVTWPIPMIHMPNGKFATITGQYLSYQGGTYTGLWIILSNNGIAPWTVISDFLPFHSPVSSGWGQGETKGLVYNSVRGAFFAWDYRGGDNFVTAGSIQRMDYVVPVADPAPARQQSLSRTNRAILLTSQAAIRENVALFDITGRRVSARAVKVNPGSLSSLLIAAPNR